ncbi:hypothetical protein BKA23_0422 [Rudaeicoccus suwonensis]|uniref:Uncharacterized protein n=1 Tax=Rudaeicoccus suwonensis TaxID=657409 RepID=A0A561E7Q7_9MICO|nr:hypothetical protein BKA23_0422 [Rudaeicoccus suwonensis]
MQLYAEPPRLPDSGVNDARRQNHVTGWTGVTQGETRLNRFIVGVSACISQLNHTHVIHLLPAETPAIPGEKPGMRPCEPAWTTRPEAPRKSRRHVARMPQQMLRTADPRRVATHKGPIRETHRRARGRPSRWAVEPLVVNVEQVGGGVARRQRRQVGGGVLCRHTCRACGTQTSARAWHTNHRPARAAYEPSACARAAPVQTLSRRWPTGARLNSPMRSNMALHTTHPSHQHHLSHTKRRFGDVSRRWRWERPPRTARCRSWPVPDRVNRHMLTSRGRRPHMTRRCGRTWHSTRPTPAISTICHTRNADSVAYRAGGVGSARHKLRDVDLGRYPIG